MFGIFKKWKAAQPSSAEVVTQSNAATEALKDKWFDFNQQLKFKEEGSLAEIMEVFIIPAKEYVLSTYPLFSNASNQEIWMMVFTAVIDSGTHPYEVVNKAAYDLEKKYST